MVFEFLNRFFANAIALNPNGKECKLQEKKVVQQFLLNFLYSSRKWWFIEILNVFPRDFEDREMLCFVLRISNLLIYMLNNSRTFDFGTGSVIQMRELFCRSWPFSRVTFSRTEKITGYDKAERSFESNCLKDAGEWVKWNEMQEVSFGSPARCSQSSLWEPRESLSRLVFHAFRRLLSAVSRLEWNDENKKIPRVFCISCNYYLDPLWNSGIKSFEDKPFILTVNKRKIPCRRNLNSFLMSTIKNSGSKYAHAWTPYTAMPKIVSAKFGKLAKSVVSEIKQRKISVGHDTIASCS